MSPHHPGLGNPMCNPVPRRAAWGSRGSGLGAVLGGHKLSQARSQLGKLCGSASSERRVAGDPIPSLRAPQPAPDGPRALFPGQGVPGRSTGRGWGRSITPSHRRPPTYLRCPPSAPACCPPPAASSSPSRPLGTCRSCTPGRREKGRAVRCWPCSPGIFCLPGAHSPALRTPSRGWAAPSRMRHGRG